MFAKIIFGLSVKRVQEKEKKRKEYILPLPQLRAMPSLILRKLLEEEKLPVFR